ncbi:MAG: hypothetical protein QOI44_1232, partial [Actinomycetota bacterium]|nr:hypothetical protein [Actinomycetota bacterium]
MLSSWFARLTWVLLPVSVGGALGDALASWSSVPARVAAVFMWCAWSIGLVALLAPRPWGLTALRIVAPALILVTLASVTSAGAQSALLAGTTAIVAAVFALSASVAQSAVNSLAYGDELRFPLRVPVSLLVGPVPLAVILAGAGACAGPLLLADGRIVAGIVVTLIGLPIAYAMIRSLHSLARRFLVLVPAGVVVVDPLTLADPVLMRREEIAQVRALNGPAADGLDLRLGTRAGTIEITLRAPQSFARRRGRRDAALCDADVLLVSTVRTA